MKQNYLFKNLTTMKIGGPAKYFINTKEEKDLIKAIERADKNKIKWCVVGEGSNLIPSDNGFNGLIIKNGINDFKKNGNKITVGAGNNLLKFVFELNHRGLTGMEKMAGIPGTIGGAIFGSAGAYGQGIKDYLVRVKILDVGGEYSVRSFSSRPARDSEVVGRFVPRQKLGNRAKTASESARRILSVNIRWLSKKQCRFGYRESIFKENKKWVILAAEFKFKKGDPKELQKTSKEIIKIRKKKYRPGLLCPGSFFKNIVINNVKPMSLRRRFLKKIDKNRINRGKLPSGYLLEAVGANGYKIGDIKVAKHHGNLIYNAGRGKSSEILKLAKILKEKVRKRFGINLEEEIQYL